MDLKCVFLRTTRWGAVATAAATTAAMCVTAAPAQIIAGAPAPVHAATVATSSGFSGAKWGDPAADSLSKDAYGKNAAEKDPGSLFTVENAIGARGLWALKDSSKRNLTGQGVSVAVLDSGVSQVAGLDAVGKVTYGPDLSIEGNGVLTQQDTFGHGTFMAGIIAGRGTTNPSSDLHKAPGQIQLGVAPDANLLAMKLATTDGSTDVSQVIAALDWVTQHPVLQDGTRIRVINLSYGTNSAQSYLADPLAAAAENAWRHGIVVVTSAGNNGADNGRLTDPAIDPYVIAVGATDSGNSVGGWLPNHAIPASFSEVGSASRHVDLVAPGTSLVSARAPGSFVDVNYPSGLVAGDVTGNLFRGSGTSQAAAVVSGSVALLLQAYPTLTPDQVKYALTSSASVITNANPLAVGAGTLDLGGALDTAGILAGTAKNSAATRTSAVQSFANSTGSGSINAARGGSLLVDAAGKALSGEIDVQGNPWNAAAWWKATSSLTAWSGGKWLGTTYTGDDWQPAAGGLTVTAGSLTATTGGLASGRWSSGRWSSGRWSTANWSSSTWTSGRWSSGRWSSDSWCSGRWSSSAWG